MKRMSSWLVMWCLVALLAPVMASAADEFSFFGGSLRGVHDQTFVIQMEYLKILERKPFAFSISTVDEGHVNPGTNNKHHRDGFITQAWAYHKLTPRLSVWGGIGPYLYYDTQSSNGRPVFETGLAAIATADIKYQMTENWFIKLRTNAIMGNVDTQSVLFGVGRNLTVGKTSRSGNDLKNQISLMGSPENWNVELRRAIARNVELSGAYYDGNKARGMAAELWLVNRFFDEKLKIGIGMGPYRDLLYDDSRWSGIVTAMARYAVHPRWDLIVQWDRVHTHHRGDTDLNSIGIGYNF